jgi:PKD repeat protein
VARPRSTAQHGRRGRVHIKRYPLTEITAKIDGKTVTLGRTAQDDGALRETSWDFGDGKTATGKSAQHSYAEAGIYLVRCRVQDDGGSRNSKWKLIRIPAK